MKLLGICILLFANIFSSKAQTCQETMNAMLASQMGGIVPCIKQLGYTNGQERADNFYCIMKCMLVQAGTLTKDGNVTIRQAVEFILESIPLEIMDKAFGEISKCQKHAMKELADPADKKCLNYGPLIGCSIQVIINLCK